MSKVFISRQDGSISWGFRLQGGLEYNEPLTVTNVSSNLFEFILNRCVLINQQREKNQEVLSETYREMDIFYCQGEKVVYVEIISC